MDFTDYYSDILTLINTDAGRKLVGITDRDRIFKVSPNSYHLLRKKGYKTGVFFIENDIAKIFIPIIDKMRIAQKLSYKAFLHYGDLKRGSFPQIYLATQQFNSNTAGTGQVRDTEAQATGWATIIGRATGTAADASSDPYAGNILSGGNLTCARGYTPFDTSSIGSGATLIPGANTIQLYVNINTTTDSLTFGVFASTQASNITLATSDYSLIGSTLFASIAATSLTLNSYNTLTLNPTGEANLSKVGFSKFAYRLSGDYNSVAPTGDNTTSFRGGANANHPILTINYTTDDFAYFV